MCVSDALIVWKVAELERQMFILKQVQLHRVKYITSIKSSFLKVNGISVWAFGTSRAKNAI